jgi:hypothetical protein
MKWITTCRAWSASVILAGFLATLSLHAQSDAQSPSFGICKPVSERTTELGCWILMDHPVGRFQQAQVSWHLDVYATRREAEKAKGPRGSVVESQGKIWLLTIEEAGWRPTRKGERIAEIGPLPVTAGEQYSALFMDGILNPGMTSAIHTLRLGSLVHIGWRNVFGNAQWKIDWTARRAAGDRAWRCTMLLTATGNQQRRALTLILHESSKPPTTVVYDWKPKGLCTVS